MIIIKHISRIIAGLVFIFSGLVKGVDPMGSMYKFIDYFTAFNMESLEPLAYILGIILCTTEFIIGFSILAGIRIREASWGLLLFMVGFTPLTLILAITNPVSDCGCFGDAIHLSNWQTFFKNIIILLFVIIVFVNRKKFRQTEKKNIEWAIIAIISIGFILFTQYNLKHLPIVDFRPYKIGASIPEGMQIPENAAIDEYETSLIYEKDGIKKEFTLETYPSDDNSWVFVDSKTKLIKQGYSPPIYDFSLISTDKYDLTESILSDPGYTLLMVSIKLSDAKPDLINKGIEAAYECMRNGIGFYILTSSPDEVLNYDEQITALSIDETTIKTIIRSNPGFMVLKKGVVTAKWAATDLPRGNDLIQNIVNSFPPGKDKAIMILLIMLSVITIISLSINHLLIKK